jgi:tape measure domain-containing protein
MSGTSLIAKIILRLQDEASRGLDTAKQRIGGIGDEVNRVKQLMVGLFSFVAIKQGIENLVGLSDKYTELSSKIKLATQSKIEYAKAQVEDFDIAQRTRTALDSVVGLYTKVQRGIRELGGTQTQALQITEATAQAFKISGASAAASAGGIEQFTQAIQSGVFRGDEFNSVMEAGPRLAQALADGLGVPITALRGMAEAGELTSERVIAALLSQKDALAREYAQMSPTVSGFWQQLENKVLQYVGQSKDASEATRIIGAGVSFVTEHLDGLVTLAVKSGEVLLAAFGINKLNGLISYAQSMLAARAATVAATEAAVTAATAASAEADAIAAATAVREAEIIATQEAIVVARAEALAKLEATNATIAQARVAIAALEATVQTTTTTWLLAQATTSLAAAEGSRSAILADLALLGQQNVRVTAELAATQEALAAATVAQGEAAAAAAANTGRAISGLAAVGKSAFALMGGWVGVAVIGLYGLYTALEKVTGSEEKAAVKTKAHADALALMNAEVKQLSAAEVDIDFAKTEHNIDAINEKIKGLETFSLGKLFDLGDLSAQRANLLQTLDILKQKKEALVAQKNSKIMNFDASALSAAELNAELAGTKAKIDEIHQRVDPLKKQLDAGLIGREAVNADLAELQAYEAKFAALSKKAGDTSFEVYQLGQSLSEIPKASDRVAAAMDAMATGIDTALKKTKETAQAHATEMVKPYDEAAKAIISAFDAQSTQIDANLKNRLNAINTLAASEKQKIEETTQAVIAAEFEKTTAALNTKIQLDKTWNETYGKAIELARKAGADVTALEKQGADDRIGSLQSVVNAYQSSVDNMIGEEQRLLDAIRHTAEERANLSRSVEDKIRALQQKGMTDVQAYADQQKQVDEKQAAAKKAILEGNFSDAKKYAEEAIRLAESTAHAVDNVNKDAKGKEHRKEAISENQAVSKSIEQIKESAALADQALSGLGKAQTEQAANIASSLKGAQSGLAEFKGELDKAIADANSKAQLKISVDAQSAQAEIDKLAVLTAAKELTAKIQVDPINADKEIADLQAKLTEAKITVPAVVAFDKMRDEELAKIQEELRKSIAFLTAVPVGVDTSEAVAKLESMKADIDAKLSTPTEAAHKVNPDFEVVFSAINEIKQNTFSTHTVYVNEVQQHAAGGPIQHRANGGLIQRLAAGGRVAGQTFRKAIGYIRGPGTTTSDDVPIMASDKEYMQRAAAVAHYGVKFMDDVNNMRLPIPPGYATGGPIGSAASSAGVSTPSSAPAGETMTLVFKFDNKSIPGQFAPGNARALAVELRRLASVS